MHLACEDQFSALLRRDSDLYGTSTPQNHDASTTSERRLDTIGFSQRLEMHMRPVVLIVLVACSACGGFGKDAGVEAADKAAVTAEKLGEDFKTGMVQAATNLDPVALKKLLGKIETQEQFIDELNAQLRALSSAAWSNIVLRLGCVTANQGGRVVMAVGRVAADGTVKDWVEKQGINCDGQSEMEKWPRPDVRLQDLQFPVELNGPGTYRVRVGRISGVRDGEIWRVQYQVLFRPRDAQKADVVCSFSKTYQDGGDLETCDFRLKGGY